MQVYICMYLDRETQTDRGKERKVFICICENALRFSYGIDTSVHSIYSEIK